ncbi:RecF/RecN/SMC [Piptocephalis cylindrospora]|uniref:Structural maintenance of chromosomes protein n=1 Tax=Piptocephalis cylindrospora TaxID=1907219 RepID=A0A4P9Y6L9_9FUNG|nr:RecF/RecN/SMC [Piptocephalis cylindrospora]|eukprot:RKP14746.1 RecF/RecN/SMC [Piptocephalis cylindrospora]
MSGTPRVSEASGFVKDEAAQAAHKPRLVMVSMTLKNFKSYAGTQVLGPFHRSFSAVVGPNGSGKSNVIDALLFVFGWRASKMRQGKLSGLIHASGGHDPIDSCSVEITFHTIIDDEASADGFRILPDSQLLVSRVAYRNNTSKYFINSRSSTYTDVTALLKSHGVDLEHKRFLILQGEVESISQMKAKAPTEHEDGLLEYLEDIIGTARYKTPIAEATSHLESLGEERSERIGRVRFVEKEKEKLEDAKNEAEMFCRNENALALTKSSLFQREHHDWSKKCTLAEESMVSTEKELKEETEKHAESMEGAKQLNQRRSSLEKESEWIERDSAKDFAARAKCEEEGVLLAENRKHVMSRLSKAKKTMERVGKKHEEVEASITQYAQDLEEEEEEMARTDVKLRDAEEELDQLTESLKERTAPITQRIEGKQRELAPWSEKAQKIRSKLTVLRQELGLVQERTRQGSSRVQEATEALEVLKQEHEGKGAQVQELEGAYARRQDRLEKELRPRLRDLMVREEEARRKMDGTRDRLEEAEKASRTVRSQSSVLTHILRLGEGGRVRGINDRLGNLGIIDAKYDVAVSTACAALDDVVVDTTDAGQRCLEHLRRQQLGSCRFILLDKLPTFRMDPISTPEGLPRLFDLITTQDPRFSPAFYHGLRDTLVAQDLAQANRVAFGSGGGRGGKRWRVVTVDGQLIEPSGTISGGGRQVSRGRMASSFPSGPGRRSGQAGGVGGGLGEAEISQLRDVLVEEESTWKTLVDKRRAVTGEVGSMEAMLPKEKIQGEKLQMEVKGLEREMVLGDERLRRAREVEITERAEIDKGEARVVELEEAIAASESELVQVDQEVGKVEEELKGLQEEILRVGGDRVRDQRHQIQQYRERLDQGRGRIVRMGVERDRATKEVERLRGERDSSSREVTSLQGEVEDLKEKEEARLQELKGVEGACSQAEEALREKRSQLEKVERELSALEETLSTWRIREAELRGRIRKSASLVDEGRRRMKQCLDAAKRLTLHDLSYMEDVTSSDLQAEEESSSSLTQFPTLTPGEMEALDVQTLHEEVARLERLISEAQPNLGVLEEWRARHEEYRVRASELADITRRRDGAKEELEDLRGRRLTEFMEGFTAISYKLKEMYQMITLGGNAELELVDSLDPFSEGIVFSVMPPRKSWKNISNLSGGEKTLSSLALVFALHHFKPTPIYVMDEIDAALDFRNVSIVANYIKERTRNAQFIIISLRNNMFELADRLVGIYKTDNKTKSVTINPQAVAAAAGTSM